jgi:hypothetical protein
LKGFSGYGAVFMVLLLGSVFQATPSGLTYTCDSNPNDPGYVDPTTCNYLQTTIAGLYNSTFSNINANIYVEYGTISGLAQSQTPFNLVPYSNYLNALTASDGNNTIDVDALSALNSLDTAIYGQGNVNVTSALGTALGLSGMDGLTASGNTCFTLNSTCYDGIVTVTTQANLTSQANGQTLWYRTGTQPSNSYDFYSAVEHETDEVLGTASCVGTRNSALFDYCGSGVPSAVDLFRYSSVGQLVPISSLSTTPGAYFSWNGGATNGADGAVYNTLPGQDYADFTNNCQFVQDSMGCLGQSFDITTDGGAEINILNAEGFNLATPEPAAAGMMTLGFTTIGAVAWRRRRTPARIQQG